MYKYSSLLKMADLSADDKIFPLNFTHLTIIQELYMQLYLKSFSYVYAKFLEGEVKGR